MKKIKIKAVRMMAIMLCVSVAFVFSATFTMATTINSPTSQQKFTVGQTVTIKILADSYVDCAENKNYCEITAYSMARNGLKIFEKVVTYTHKNQTLKATFTLGDVGEYKIFATCYHKVNGFKNYNKDRDGSGGMNMYVFNGTLKSADACVTISSKAKVTTPKKTSIVSLKSKSKAFQVKWKKVSCTGYQIRYSTSSKMKSAKKVKIKGSKTVSKTIKKLKSKKKYYVQVRTYKTANGKTKYSSWSKKKSVKTK